MTKQDLIKRGALSKLVEIVRFNMDSCNKKIEDFHIEVIDGVFSSEEQAEIDHIIKKLNEDRFYLKLFCEINGIL